MVHGKCGQCQWRAGSCLILYDMCLGKLWNRNKRQVQIEFPKHYELYLIQ